MHFDRFTITLLVLRPDAPQLSDDDADTVLPGARRAKAGYAVDNLQSLFFFSRSETIWGGAAEIQRNIVGERALGLPKEPKPQ